MCKEYSFGKEGCVFVNFFLFWHLTLRLGVDATNYQDLSSGTGPRLPMCCMSLPSPEFCFVFLALPHFLTSKTVGFLLFVCLFYSYQNPFLAMYHIANSDLLQICVNKNGARFHVSTLELQFFKEQCMVNIIIKCSLRMKIFSILP